MSQRWGALTLVVSATLLLMIAATAIVTQPGALSGSSSPTETGQLQQDANKAAAPLLHQQLKRSPKRATDMHSGLNDGIARAPNTQPQDQDQDQDQPGAHDASKLTTRDDLAPACDNPGNAGLEKFCSDFLTSYNIQATQLRRSLALAQFAYETNITDANLADMQVIEANVTAFDQQVVTGLRIMLTFGQLPDYSPASVNAALCPVTARQVNKLLLSDVSSNATRRAEISSLVTQMQQIYATTTVCLGDQTPPCTNNLEPELASILADPLATPAAKLEAWLGWHNNVGVAVSPLFAQFVQASNAAAVENGFANTGEFWQSGYDMPAADFVTMIDNLWTDVQPLYNQLHCHVRRRLSAHYGSDVVPPEGPIPAHLLGDMWAQAWSNVASFVLPYPDVDAPDVTAALLGQGKTALELHELSESFYSSLGFQPLPASFWSLSMLERPQDRDVVCHASAWDLEEGDLRIKMCTVVNEEDLYVVHHEQGHLFYDQSYAAQPPLFREAANDGFHEAVGDTIRLSVSSPRHLEFLQLATFEGLPEAELAQVQLNALMGVALDKLAFLPFGYMLDKWRWQVFSGSVAPEQYNDLWWQLRFELQGVAPPNVPRPSNILDPGAKFHVAANVPYVRYFLAFVLQFQFHDALCRLAGYSGPLSNCDIYNSAEAGHALREMLALGSSKSWPEALEVLTGTQQISVEPMIAFFQPLLDWLETENDGQVCTWGELPTPATTDVPQASSATPEASSATPEVSSATPEVSSATPEVSSATPEVSSATPEVSSATPEVSSATPDVSSATPTSTAAATSTKPAVVPPKPIRYGEDLTGLWVMIAFGASMLAFGIGRLSYYRVKAFLQAERYNRYDDEQAILDDDL
ncbi:zinc-dependent metallopeptidase [Capsaspora owczarzaki ATCC 30864]|uniref:Angiotensin-converting enzyme n=1 Tax=Capsaspora owczarzaki (strain ATCC 30864) TaxID=595528 RepID=A0A0D2X4M9_CAPO3|nr:zinc-dependent metallopeptidase [Capsaspora owczarzaki ATCC 30864]KJE96339.1 zinc-dependent metallopeptidase [Capsaspora owczarzaki ATCC 30864]|eukprot:XP_004344300.1 zinc-dependent metallopeptidase [Capsaspora owczarzaki ATCC 30864]